jgi:inner membrane protein
VPTILTHPAVPLGLGLGLGSRRIPPALLLAGMAGSILPDLDVAAFRFGIPYAAAFGHRGLSHSLLFAAAVAALGAGVLRAFRVPWVTSLWFLFVATASHGLLDACTTGGLGVALLWPWREARYFAPFRVIRVAPLSLARFFSPRGLVVMQSELLWVWLPCLGLGGLAAWWRKSA